VRALVTGATGFVGSHLVARLVAAGDAVTVLARPTSDLRRLRGLEPRIVHGDVTDPASVRRAVRGHDVVFHCAAMLEFGSADPHRLTQVNVEGTRNVLHAATDEGAMAVHVSSVAVYGATGPSPVDETYWSDVEPISAYERTKRAAHLVARDLASRGAPVRIGVPGGVYGFGDESSMAKLIATFARYPTPVGYLPDVVQSLVNVDDCADGLARVASRGRDGEEYFLCADVVPFREWFELIAAGAGRRPPLVYVPTRLVQRVSRPVARVAQRIGLNGGMLTEMVNIATRHQAFSGAKARTELGWAPRTLRQGMAEMCDAIRGRPRR
jgi:dihydroflavonol-4-reductase